MNAVNKKGKIKKTYNTDPIGLMGDILPLIQDKWLDTRKVLDICEKYTQASQMPEEEQLSIRILFLTGLLNEVIKQIPLKLYQDVDVRENIINSMQGLIDDLVKEEEEYFNALEESDESEN